MGRVSRVDGWHSERAEVHIDVFGAVAVADAAADAAVGGDNAGVVVVVVADTVVGITAVVAVDILKGLHYHTAPTGLGSRERGFCTTCRFAGGSQSKKGMDWNPLLVPSTGLPSFLFSFWIDLRWN